MKYIIILGDGMAGEPLECIGGKTTLEQALTPEMDRLAKMSEIGLVSMVPEGMAPGSDTANLSVLGYNPEVYYTGRSPLEALSIGVGMEEDDVSFRCNLVTLTEDASLPYEDQRIVDHSSDEINTRDAGVLLEVLKEEVLKPGFELYRGTSYRHLLLWKNGHEMELTPPHDILTNQIREYLPGDPMLLAMMKESYRVLKEHPVNLKRKAQGLRPANSAWFWGAGKRPKLPDFQEKTGKRGVMISAVDLLKGIAAGSGMKIVHVEGADGGLHTNYEGKAQSAVRALLDEGYDFAYIHVEAPDEMGHQGSVEKKVRAIEFLDQRLIRIVREAMDSSGEPYRLLILPDHPTPIAARTHTADPVPYLLYDRKRPENGAESYCERTAVQSGRWEKNGYHLIEHLFEY
ncbi:cofactor-independent phosphoglycerate mutase [Drancourtella massiliensis]|uniref:Cofactor-independent phosphoglycerate mutase n=1 Tax=Drancourtella massiliensis TaxID=1632013 RepID=A0ABS2EHA1_9FIRM|nr:cofactor-independent phosphoglycerate mutase [Drancourtella massiliensis]MBM6744296.1 cofactor-independent phosphoglycerate mutase [Drancourtella massiliensis]